MNTLRQTLLRLSHASPERKNCRAHLLAAKKGAPEQYLALAAHYLDLAQGYFENSLNEDRQTHLDRTGQIFAALWQHLPYAERLSDFEYMLAASLIGNTPRIGPVHPTDPIVTRIRRLDPQTRFALLAYEFERWSPRWVSLLMRCKPGTLHQLIAEARCTLCGVDWDPLSPEEKNCLVAISFALESCPKLKVNRALSKRFSRYPRIIEIKAQWLELRPHLVEIRQHYRLGSQEREASLNTLLSDISQKPMHRPALVDRVLNTVHFSRYARIKVS